MSVFLICFLLAIPASPNALTGQCTVAHEAIPVLQSDEHMRGDKFADPSEQVVCRAPGDTMGQTTYDWWSYGAPKRAIALPPPGGCIYLFWTASNQPEPWVDLRARSNVGSYPGEPSWLFGTGMDAGTDVSVTWRNSAGSIDQNSAGFPFLSIERYMASDRI
jgi:hypothetical protein